MPRARKQQTFAPPKTLLEQLEIEESKRACERSLSEFTRQAWHIIEPGVPYVDGWHLDAINEHLEAITNGVIRFLLINMPPRHMKSIAVGVMWPCWEWTKIPHHKYLTASYSALLTTRDNLKARRLVSSQWYQERWGKVFQMAGDQNQKTRFENDKTGYRIASSVGGTATGEGGSRLLLDDPHGAMDAQSESLRDSTIEWFDQTWSTRMNNPKTDAMVTVMQRLHEKDVSGRILELGGWEHLCLPCEYDKKKRKTKLGAYDPRIKKGELLWPERFGTDEINRLKIQLGDYGTAGQLQQIPAPLEGGIIKPDYFRLWPNDEPLPPLTYVIQSYDTAHTEKKSNDPTACTVWGIFYHKKAYHVILLDAWSDFLTYPKLRSKAIRDWSTRYGGTKTDPANKPRRADAVLIEMKASGHALLQDCVLAKMTCARADPGDLDKEARAHVIAPILHAGFVWVPESKVDGEWASWADDMKKQLARFPNDEHDDYVDTFTQAMKFLRDRGFIKLPEAIKSDTENDGSNTKPRVNPYFA